MAAMKGICFLFCQAEITLEKEEEKRKNEMPEKRHATWGELIAKLLLRFRLITG
jgi:hypothetical protein